MKVLIGVASHEMQRVSSLRTCTDMLRELGDSLEIIERSRGDQVRRVYAEMVMQDDFYGPDDGLLLLDGDQQHPLDMLMRMKRHNVDMVCAHYYARDNEEIRSMCYIKGEEGYRPYINPPREGLHEIEFTGFGCVLIKKKVLMAMKENTPGDRNMMETDFKFFCEARQLGYKLYLDASLNSEHALTVWLDHETAERLRK